MKAIYFPKILTYSTTRSTRLGQMKAGNTIRFPRVSLTAANAKHRRVQELPPFVDNWCRGRATFEDAFSLRYSGLPPSVGTGTWGSAIVHQIQEKGNQPLVSYRQGGDDFFLVDYGHGAFDLSYHYRAVALYQKLHEASGDITFTPSLYTGMTCGNSLFLTTMTLKSPAKSSSTIFPYSKPNQGNSAPPRCLATNFASVDLLKREAKS
ncbi:hypothetical protein EPUS_05930 [Endocarpon pusillum Z07020]|uniref:Uncharacterized protein n=1 Tax=Endocarpon pusillum (strain Z07020 / HMAS-L-300199) TaxID=1263415 RepID=U1HGV4_ENDPU|nr:uncharacterized protein EPUS_05930 [Endocarpon pusillum Z07020]ERF69385.1 hypothetical protein EPUS_05930 [Endocarpon pusillum Z07020]